MRRIPLSVTAGSESSITNVVCEKKLRKIKNFGKSGNLFGNFPVGGLFVRF
jgi:hypothetical protein